MHLILDPRSDSSGKRNKRRYPNKWVIIGIVSSIIIFIFIIGFIIFIIIRNRNKNKENSNHRNSIDSLPIPARLLFIDIFYFIFYSLFYF